jgi:hypothetical protein
MLLNASALIIFFTFLVLSINFKLKKKKKKKFLFFLLIKLYFLVFLSKQKIINLIFEYFPLVDFNTNLIFSLNDLQKLGFLMYYYYFF